MGVIDNFEYWLVCHITVEKNNLQMEFIF